MSAKLWAAAVVAVALLAAIAAAAVQTYRLKAANSDVTRITGERDAAIEANAELADQAEREKAAAVEWQGKLERYRRDYERGIANARKTVDDGCLDRVLPPDIRGLLGADDPGPDPAAGVPGS